MCGVLCGETKSPFSPDRLADALGVLHHRGPNGAKVAQFENCFLGHTRLSIVGLADGVQPLSNEDGTLIASVNGEFYGHEALRAELAQRGHVFKTHSDSEILLHLYEEMGVDCLQKLHGEFAFVLYDKRQRRWFCARDRVGIRPLQYWCAKGQFLVASEAKALFKLGVPARLNRQSVWHAQHVQYLPQSQTLFDGVRMVRPGHFILVRDQVVTEHAYWNLNEVSEQVMTFEQATDRAVELLEQAVTRRTPLEVPWACHLSGGIDSSIVTALSQSAPGAGHCFTVRFTDDHFYDESPFARETAQYLGATLHEVPVSFADILQALPAAVYHSEGLSINGHLGAKYLLNQAMRQAGFKVALTGEGADELFMGYSHLKQDYLSAAGVTRMEKEYLAGVQLPSGSTLDLSVVQQRLGFVPTWVAAKSSMAFKLSQLWHGEFIQSANPYEQMLDESGICGQHVSNLKKSSSLWMQYCLSGYILKVLDDAQAMAHGIEGRLPFLDTELLKFMWSVPDAHYFHEGVEKGLLRKGFANRLPARIVAKTKQSFMSPPVHRALAQPSFKGFVQDQLLSNAHFRDQDLFKPAAIAAFLADCEQRQSPEQEPILMTLLSLAILCERFQL
jgi:asparagine synthase (glutamine-hydrolysing)